MRPPPSIATLVSLALFASGAVHAAPTAAPPPTQPVVTDATMAIVNKRQSGAFTLRWTPAHDALGHDRKAYDLLVVNCADVRTAAGETLPPAVGGRLLAMSGPPYAVLLSGCSCSAAVAVSTRPVASEMHHSMAVEARRGTIFGPPCR